ncbi:hypothetical protein SAMN05216283_101925 [Sunxiuqinia elliptica]|uniref:Uncharacterized protein n=1 Tax=Sunxiuqinia elliptica TaxID=655355 RepID=A0A1I2D3Q2_9BACT|nr:hypothetical protein SAMN05216283_101925 [Sunxiuqinia elliptica]
MREGVKKLFKFMQLITKHIEVICCFLSCFYFECSCLIHSFVMKMPRFLNFDNEHLSKRYHFREIDDSIKGVSIIIVTLVMLDYTLNLNLCQLV